MAGGGRVRCDRGGAQRVRRGGVRMRVGSVIISISVGVAARIDHLAGAENRTAVAGALGIAASGSPCWQLLAHSLGERQGTTRTCVAVRAANALGSFFGRGRLLGTKEVRVVFDLRGAGSRGFTNGAGCLWRTLAACVVRGGLSRGFGIRMALCTGERKNLGADDRSRAMQFAKVRQRQLCSIPGMVHVSDFRVGG